MSTNNSLTNHIRALCNKKSFYQFLTAAEHECDSDKELDALSELEKIVVQVLEFYSLNNFKEDTAKSQNIMILVDSTHNTKVFSCKCAYLRIYMNRPPRPQTIIVT